MKPEKHVNIKNVGLVLFALACVFCVYKIIDLNFLTEHVKESREQVDRLALVSVFTRHGDRAPSDSLHPIDKHSQNPLFFWPNGLSNLTDIGKMREYRIGLALRKQYDSFLGYDTSKVLVMSSPMYRCIESSAHILRGLYELEWGRQAGQRYAALCLNSDVSNTTVIANSTQQKDATGSHSHCKPLPAGVGAGDAWRRVPIDTKLLPMLTYEFLNNCKYRKQNPSAVDEDLLKSADIKALPGVDALARVLRRRYGLPFNYTGLYIYSNIISELSLMPTQETLHYNDHFMDWIDIAVNRVSSHAISAPDAVTLQNSSLDANITVFSADDAVNAPHNHTEPIRLLDVYEAVNLFAYRDRLQGDADYIQTGSIVTSMIESQLVALGQLNSSDTNRAKPYENKRAILYISHDTTIQKLLWDLNIIDTRGLDYESRFHKLNAGARHDNNLIEPFLAGVKMSSYGMSVRFELWNAETKIVRHYTNNSGTKPQAPERPEEQMAYVKAHIYNNDDGRFAEVKYKQIDMGRACNHAFRRKYPNATKHELASFYPNNLQLDTKASCPFNLLRNVTSHLMVSEERIKQLCDD